MGREFRGPLSEIDNFFLLQYPSALGTAIHATPLIPALRHAVPGCRIAVAASGFALEILRNHPGVDHLIETPSPVKNFSGAVKALRGKIPFETGSFATITSTGNERSLIAIHAVLCGATTRVGFALAPALYRAPLTFDARQSQIANNLRIIDALGHTPKHFEPEIFFSEADLASARETIRNAGIGQTQPVAIFVTQTSVTQRKGWRAERFRAVAQYLHERYGAHILFIGTEAESGAIDELRNGLPFSTTSVAGRTTLPGLTALMSLANIGLSLDTGPMHIGRAAGLPMAIIAPAWSPPLEWLPLNDDRFCILKNKDMEKAPEGYIIDEVSIEEVIAALEGLFARFPRESLYERRRG
ncbi:MAG: glycosyltransferase family 9 protein [Acidobacteria bacterium]|nr:glycosyltransferase family 9 protein [Acidobacteriota bacterium]